MRSRLVVALVVVALAVAGVVAWRWYADTHREPAAISGSGIIEVTQVDAAFEVPGRMIERFVDEGAMVDGGEPIARLDDREYQLHVDRAAAAESGAEARYKMMVRGSREHDVDQALAALEAAESTLRLQQLEYERIATPSRLPRSTAGAPLRPSPSLTARLRAFAGG